MKRALLLVSLVFGALTTYSQKYEEIDLWPNGFYYSNGRDITEPFADSTVNYKPSIRVYFPDKEKGNGKTILCCPGGAYQFLALGHEGYDWAPFFTDMGYTFVVLKYRMPIYNHNVPLSDVREAIRVIKENAEEWSVYRDQIGIMGSSAGGHLASTAATHLSGNERPAFQILFYPVITFDKSFTHPDSRSSLIGMNPPEALIQYYCNEKMVTAKTPPAIIFYSDDDATVDPLNGVIYYNALKRFKIPASLHIYPSGKHGWGYGNGFKYQEDVHKALRSWLESLDI